MTYYVKASARKKIILKHTRPVFLCGPQCEHTLTHPLAATYCIVQHLDVWHAVGLLRARNDTIMVSLVSAKCGRMRSVGKISHNRTCTEDPICDLINKNAIQGTPHMSVDKEAVTLSRVYSYYSMCNLPLFYV